MMRAASSLRRPLGLRSGRSARRSSQEPAAAPAIHARRPRRGRRDALWVPLWLLTLAACGGPVSLQPNLLLVTVDTLRPDRLACYGGPGGTGEEICGIGESGARYSWVISPSPFTSVAIASILTSRYPSEHGMTAFASSALPSNAVTLADALRAGGYKTAAFVANPTLNRSRNLHQGFDLYEDRLPALPSLPAEATGTSRRSASSLTDAALAFAEVSEAPWFIWVHFVETRGPYSRADLESEDEIAGTSLPRGWRSTRLRRLEDQSGRGGVPAYQLDVSEAQATEPNSTDVAGSRSGPQTVSSGDLLRRYG